MILLAVDPGIRGCGVAIFAGTDLARAGYVKNECKSGNGPREAAMMAWKIQAWAELYEIGGIAVEWPQVYRSAKLRGDPNDLLPLSAVAGALAALFPDAQVSATRPAEWKGQMPKDICHARVIAQLGDTERRRIAPAGALTHNVLDAVGIGLYARGRFSPRKGMSPKV